jgi:hypothetical protein
MSGDINATKDDAAHMVFNHMSSLIDVNSVIIEDSDFQSVDIHEADMHNMFAKIRDIILLKSNLPVETLPLFGITKKEKDIIDLQRLSVSVDGVVQTIDIDAIEEEVANNPEKYSGVVNAYGLGNIRKHIPELLSTVYSKFSKEMIDEAEAGQAPIFNLNKADIIKEYVSRGWEDIMYKTISCSKPVDNLNCGICDLCNERKRSFENAGVADNTVYIG